MAFLQSDTESDTNYSDELDSDTLPLNVPAQTLGPTKKWDAFRVTPPEVDSGSMAAMVWVRRFEKLMLILAFILTFVIIFISATASKGVTMLMISMISPRPDRVLAYCNQDKVIRDTTKEYEVDRSRDKYDDDVETEQVAWAWAIIFAFSVPEVGTLMRSLRICIFKRWKRPTFLDFAFVVFMEMCHVTGLAVLVFLALPQLDTTHALALTNCMAVVPGFLLLMSRSEKDKYLWLKLPLDVLAILSQLSGALVWPILEATGYLDSTMKFPWALPVGLILTSFGWWECFVEEESRVPFVRAMWQVKERLVERTRYFTYIWISILKMAVFLCLALTILSLNSVLIKPGHMFSKFRLSFDSHVFNVVEVQDKILGDPAANDGAIEDRFEAPLKSPKNMVLWVLLIQIASSYLCYIFSKFACKVQIQAFSYAVPLCSLVPACMTLVLWTCGLRASDSCAWHWLLPDHLFFECPSVGDYLTYLWSEQMFLWAAWLLAQLWITLHVWFPKSARLASTEQIFGTPMYSALSVDQSLVLNRRRDGQLDMEFEDLRNELQDMRMDDFYERWGAEDGEPGAGPAAAGGAHRRDVRPSDRITKIYGCATMWHENKEEMIEMMKSIFRIDMDYSARRLAQKYLQVIDPDYYEWETHILFDDAFELGDNDEEEQVVNQFVKLLVRVIDEAGSFVHCRNIHVKSPKRYPTPYGGRLVWTLPGKTKIVAHLKDKAKIRHKKRWSQCMYMYYLLGFKLMELPISDERKEVIAENTYLLALDGDIDFQPGAITRLVDLMKKNKSLGAACGRIHPTGSGFMMWYQRFEYAIGHWLQKATEHVIGCVLCSPGCFSLFRAKALMDDNVMCMYTTKSENARDFVQYDQGEDRWLCTLLLQRGWRVEYSAASDAFTAVPEGFDEFFNQRRRWMPSTIANIFDVLSDYSHVVKVNDDISILYIMYQMMMMVGTVLGPGTIFLMLVGAFSVAFSISNNTSFIINLFPILGFGISCFVLDSKVQLFIAQVLSAIYALIMMAVMVGILLQVQEDGWLSPSTLSIFLIGGSFILAAILHPQEFWCLPYGIIYYVTIPAMYLLLVIYSIFNLHVVSWGTREVPKKKTKAELEEEKKVAESMKKEAKKKKKDGGLLGMLMQQTGADEKGGVEFSLANLFKCMCFTHEEPNDPKKQLVKIATSLEEVTQRLGKIEGAVGGGGSSLSSRRRSSFGRRNTRAGSSFGAAAPLAELDEVELESQKSMDRLEYPSGSESSEEERPKMERDDLVNPYWIEDRDLRNGPVDFLPGVEVQFWKDLIEKYLEPLIKDVEKEKRQAADLINLRNRTVFSFFMINAIFVLVVFLLQGNKDLLFIRWPLGAKANITFNGDTSTPYVSVNYTYLELEPIGLVFVVFFAFVVIIQVIGMLFHRWGTFSQIISTTKLEICERKPKDTTDEGELNRSAYKLAHALQRHEKRDSEKENAAAVLKGGVGRRNTVHNLMRAQSGGKKRESTDLEKKFKQRLQSIRFEDVENSTEPALRRMSARRGTFAALQTRRDTYFEGERRRSTVRFERKMSVQQQQQQRSSRQESHDSDFGDDFSGSAYSFGSQHLEAVLDDEFANLNGALSGAGAGARAGVGTGAGSSGTGSGISAVGAGVRPGEALTNF